MPDLDQLTSDRFAVSYESFLRDCPHCKNAIPISGLRSRVECPECRSEIAIPAATWDELFKRTTMDWFDSTHFDATAGPSEIAEPQGRFKLEVRRTLHEAPPCIHCGAVAPAEILSSSTRCGHCDKPLKYVPLQRDFDGMTVTHVCATELDGPADATPVELPQGAAAPVAMSCPLCSANLKVTGDSPRTITCEYCSGAIYLPDELWRRFHPVKTVKRWATMHRVTERAFRARGTWFALKLPLALSAAGLGVIGISYVERGRFQLRGGVVAAVLAVVLLLWVAGLRRALPFFRAARRFRGSS